MYTEPKSHKRGHECGYTVKEFASTIKMLIPSTGQKSHNLLLCVSSNGGTIILLTRDMGKGRSIRAQA